MGKGPKRQGETQASKVPLAWPEATKPRGAWFGARRRRKLGKALLWIALPLGLAWAIAALAAPPQEPAPIITAAKSASGGAGASGEGLMEAPPLDTWAKPEECAAWAGDGQCKANAAFMSANCAFSCAKLDYARQRYEKRCPRPENYTAALAPGQMRHTFARVMRDFPELEPEMISDDPPVILFHSFLRDTEAEALKRHGRGRYSKSLGVGMLEDGTMGDVKTEIRTSSHGWCSHRECLEDEDVRRVVGRVTDLTQTPETNAEFAQLVYYHACPQPDDPSCAFYKRHSDYIDGDEHKLQGVRIYTLFTYLNDVPEGGGTRFTDLPGGEVLFQPKKGKAILWPSVLADEPHTKDDRTHHEALPYDFKGAYAKGCTAS